jgi:Protein of unknown function (DUF2905)
MACLNYVMYTFFKIFIVVVLALALFDWLADRDRRADTNIPNARPGWAFLSGDRSAIATPGWAFLSGDRSAIASAIANENPKGTVPPGQSFLPGDIKYESPNGNVRIYFPIVTSLVLSVLFTLILRFVSPRPANR